MNNLYKDKLDEIVYELKDTYQEEEIKDTIEFFFNELIQRKRVDLYEGGLQASGLIYKNKAGFKVNEEDGYGEHLESQINLYRYLKDKLNFYTKDGINNFNLTIEDTRNMVLNGTLITILCGKDEFEFIFIKKFASLNNFEKNIIKEVIKVSKRVKDKKLIRKINLKIDSKELIIEDEINNNTYNNIISNFKLNKKSK